MLSLVHDMSVTFEALLLLLPPSQARVLESLALDPTDSPQSNAYIKKHQLSRGGGLQGALTSLEQKGVNLRTAVRISHCVAAAGFLAEAALAVDPQARWDC
jgi:hypothetical protein